MTFARQLLLVRLLLALFAALVATSLLLTAADQEWLTFALLLPVKAAVVWLIYVQWRVTSQHRSLADVAEQLRTASRNIPSGMDRIYTSVLSPTAIHCHPNSGSGFDDFSRIDGDDIEGIRDAQAGDVANLPTVTYRVRRSWPVVWRHMWVDRAVKDRQGDFVSLPRPSTGYADVLKLFLLNHRAGVLVPDRTELTDLLHFIQTADHARDVPQ
ncbi:hypothetical protein ADL27_57220, partial [Streptomyces sp. NRRL F-6602]